ncbi:FtsX-like permease family protein [Metabacillus sp. JX24]|uniref:FtsX-like permease family protein n=1 Tax=Metabacillus sp. JX24 TaxID=3240759 RepID=UPI00350FFC8C
MEKSLYDKRFTNVYSHDLLVGSQENRFDFYRTSPAYNTQLGASLLLGAIGITLSVIALFNTFAVIMSVRKKEFGNLRIVGAKKGQLIKMTLIETLIVVATGLIIGLAILFLCVGFYSSANSGEFDFVVNAYLFYFTTIASAILGILAGIIPSVLTILKMKRQFNVE